MYQVPVGNVERIRKARKAVKNVLSEFGLEDCQNLLKDLNEKKEKSDSDEEEAFQETDWTDLTDGYGARRQKKWQYRSRSVCCNLCRYSSQSIYNFRSHVSRSHGYVQSFCALAPCSQCVFIAHPKVVKRHMLLFHSKPPPPPPPVQRDQAGQTHRGNEKYQCRRCGFPNSSIFAMKKHIILKHLEGLAERYVGYRYSNQGTSTVKVYCCKVCKLNIGNLDQMLHHMLVEPAHYTVSTQVQVLIHENKNYTIKPTPNGNGLFVTFPSIAPKIQQAQIINSKSLVLPANGQAGGTMVALQQIAGTGNGATLICTPGGNQAFLPPQASALVQLASAEAKGLLQPGATIALRSALSQQSLLQLPTVSNVSLKQTPMVLTQASAAPAQPPKAHQILVPAPPNVVGAHKPAVVTATAAAPTTNQINLQGTMLTSQSLLNHLIPTGNRVNGMPTYTFAPLHGAMPVSQSTSTPLKAVEQSGNSAPQAKKWITCPLCNELFPSNVFDLHTEAAHQSKNAAAAKSESVAARASFLKKMPDKTVKCLTCKILLSEKSLFQHLLHGLHCLYCSALFFSIKQLAEHVKQHNPTTKAYCDFLRQKYRVYSRGAGEILFPYFDVQTTAPKEVLGDGEVNLALVTSTMDLIYFKLQPSNQPEVCPAPAKVTSPYCPFCDEQFANEAKHLQHLKQKHFVAPTIHAILKTEAFKCIYCNGVYTGKVTQQAVMIHIQRCRCAPKPAQAPKPAAPPQPQPQPQPQPARPTQQIIQQPGLYFLQVPPGMTVKQATLPVTATRAIKPATAESEAERLSKKRLEDVLKQVMEANKREREEKVAVRRQKEQGKAPPPPEPELPREPKVKLVLEPPPVLRRDEDERRDFVSKYFNLNPYATRTETEELCKRLSLSKGELVALFSKRRSKCMKSIRRRRTNVFLGFNMTELRKLKHDLLVPEPRLAEAAVGGGEEPAKPMDTNAAAAEEAAPIE